MKAINLVLLLGFVTLSCRKVVFEPDQTDPRLPTYTQKGNQIGGALINNIAWQTDYSGPRGEAGPHDAFFITNYPVGDSTKIQLQGQINEGKDKGSSVYLGFIISQLQINTPNELPQLNGRTFTLDGTKNYAVLEDYDGVYSGNKRAIRRYSRGTGELTIKQVKQQTSLTITGAGYSYHPCIISGTFHAVIPRDSSVLDITQGRFDFIYP